MLLENLALYFSQVQTTCLKCLVMIIHVDTSSWRFVMTNMLMAVVCTSDGSHLNVAKYKLQLSSSIYQATSKNGCGSHCCRSVVRWALFLREQLHSSFAKE